jgi:hypothetical protein
MLWLVKVRWPLTPVAKFDSDEIFQVAISAIPDDPREFTICITQKHVIAGLNCGLN